MNNNKKFIITIIIIIILITGLIIYDNFRSHDYPMSLNYLIRILFNEIKNIVTKQKYKSIIYQKIDTPYNRIFKYKGLPQKNRKNTPFAGSAVIYMNNKEYVFVGMGEGQDDLLLEFKNNKLINKIANTNISSKEVTNAAASFDMNNNGKTDIIVARPSGVYIYINNGHMKFEKKKIYGPFQNSEPLSIAIGDYNKNQLPDIYISRFIKAEKLLAFQFNNPSHIVTNILLENKGNLKFEDVTNKTGAAGYQNTFTSIFIDLGSGQPDLLLANDTGKVELLKNNKGKFISEKISDNNGFWMGIGVGDYNNDGFFDLFFTNVGNTLPLTDSGGIRGNIKKRWSQTKPKNY